MKPANVLIFQDMGVKFGDFGVSIKFCQGQEIAYFKGLTQEFSLKEMGNLLRNSEEVKIEKLKENDYYCLIKS